MDNTYKALRAVNYAQVSPGEPVHVEDTVYVIFHGNVFAVVDNGEYVDYLSFDDAVRIIEENLRQREDA